MKTKEVKEKSVWDDDVEIREEIKEAVAKEIKAKTKAKTKKPGVIQTIFNTIEKADKPVSEAQILAVLRKAFPEREVTAMTRTIKCQIGAKKQPTRMERERKVKFIIGENTKGARTFKLA